MADCNSMKELVELIVAGRDIPDHVPTSVLYMAIQMALKEIEKERNKYFYPGWEVDFTTGVGPPHSDDDSDDEDHALNAKMRLMERFVLSDDPSKAPAPHILAMDPGPKITAEQMENGSWITPEIRPNPFRRDEHRPSMNLEPRPSMNLEPRLKQPEHLNATVADDLSNIIQAGEGGHSVQPNENVQQVEQMVVEDAGQIGQIEGGQAEQSTGQQSLLADVPGSIIQPDEGRHSVQPNKNVQQDERIEVQDAGQVGQIEGGQAEQSNGQQSLPADVPSSIIQPGEGEPSVQPNENVRQDEGVQVEHGTGNIQQQNVDIQVGGGEDVQPNNIGRPVLRGRVPQPKVRRPRRRVQRSRGSVDELDMPFDNVPDVHPPIAPDQNVVHPSIAADQNFVHPTAPDQSAVNPPVAPDQSAVNPPVAPDQSAVNPPVAPDQSAVNPPDAPDQSAVNLPVAPDQSAVNPPVAPDQSSGSTPRVLASEQRDTVQMREHWESDINIQPDQFQFHATHFVADAPAPIDTNEPVDNFAQSLEQLRETYQLIIDVLNGRSAYEILNRPTPEESLRAFYRVIYFYHLGVFQITVNDDASRIDTITIRNPNA